MEYNIISDVCSSTSASTKMRTHFSLRIHSLYNSFVVWLFLLYFLVSEPWDSLHFLGQTITKCILYHEVLKFCRSGILPSLQCFGFGFPDYAIHEHGSCVQTLLPFTQVMNFLEEKAHQCIGKWSECGAHQLVYGPMDKVIDYLSWMICRGPVSGGRQNTNAGFNSEKDEWIAAPATIEKIFKGCLHL